MENKPTPPAPVYRVVGPFAVLCSTEHPFPDKDKLIIVEAINGDVFIARFDLRGGIIAWPCWVVSDTQHRRANPLDLWAYYPQMARLCPPNPQDHRAGAEEQSHGK